MHLQGQGPFLLKPARSIHVTSLDLLSSPGMEVDESVQEAEEEKTFALAGTEESREWMSVQFHRRANRLPGKRESHKAARMVTHPRRREGFFCPRGDSRGWGGV